MGWRAGFRAGVRAQLSGLTPAAPCTDGIPPSLAHACGYSSRSSRNCLPTFPRIRGNGASPARHCAREKGNALGSRASACARDAENGWCMRGRFFAVFRVRTKTGQSDRARNGRRGNRRESDIARPGSEHRGKAARQRIRPPMPAAGARGESADRRREPTRADASRHRAARHATCATGLSVRVDAPSGAPQSGDAAPARTPPPAAVVYAGFAPSSSTAASFRASRAFVASTMASTRAR